MNDHVGSARESDNHRGAIFKAWLLITLIEALTLPPALLTMGHAGPEGRFAVIGWLGLLVNLPGLIVTRYVLRPGDVSLIVLGLIIYVFQAAIFGYIFFRLLRRRGK
jgi:hypothetical protein